EDADKPPKHQLETPLLVPGRKLRDRWLFSDDELQLGDDVDHEPSIRAQRLHKGVAPTAQLGVALAEKRPDEALKSLGQRRIRDTTVVLGEIARGEAPERRRQHSVQLAHDRALADTGISGNQHQLWRAAFDDAVEGGEQGIDLALAPVEFLGNQEPVWRIV